MDAMIVVVALVSVVVMAVGIVLRPELGVILILAASFVNPALMPTMEVGRLDIRPVDIVCLIVVTGLLIRASVRRERLLTHQARLVLLPVLPFVAYVGLSLVTVEQTVSGNLESSAVSFMRLVATAAVAWIAHFCLRDARALRRAMGAFAVLCIVSVLIAALEYLSLVVITTEGGAGDRVGGLLGINALGMVAGLLVLFGVVSFGRKTSLSFPTLMVVIGALGLFLSRSASSTIAAALSSALYLARRTGSKRWTPQRVVVAGFVAILAVAASAFAIKVLRPDDFAGLVALDDGSFAHRVVVGCAGLIVFLQHPLLGVGWQASSSPDVIGSDAVNEWLIRFANVPLYYLPRYAATSVHNVYIQILAELGLVGAVAAVIAVRRVKRVGGTIRRSALAATSLRPIVDFVTYGMGFMLIWWNTTPLYGGQVESFVLFVLLGALASAGFVLDRARQRVARRQDAIVVGAPQVPCAALTPSFSDPEPARPT